MCLPVPESKSAAASFALDALPRPSGRDLRARRPGRLMAALSILLLVAGCRTFNVRSDWDEGVAFEELRRYVWLEPPSSPGADPFADNSLLRKRVRGAIEANLTARGFEAVEAREQADFVVTYGVQLDEKLRVNGGGGFYGGFGGFGRWPVGYGTGIGTTDVRNYQEATLIVDFLDPKSDELLWRGWGNGFLQTRDRDRGQERFEAGIKAVLDAYPPRNEKR